MSLVAALLLGVLIGLTIGALGGGGSVITVPVLVFVIGLSAQEATTASLVIVGVTAAVAAAAHARAGMTRWVTGAVLAAVGVPAAVLGTHLNRLVDPNVLLVSFAALMLVAATGMLIRPRADESENADAGAPRHPQPADVDAARNRPRSNMARWGRLAAAALLIGFLTGFLGVGGGFIVVPVLVVGLGLAMPVAVGTSLLVIALNSAVALVARAGHDSFAWEVILPFTAAAMAGAFGGKYVAGKLPSPALTRTFAILLLVVALYTMARAGLQLT